MAAQTSNKRLQITKAGTMMFGIIALSAFVVAFSVVASRSLLDKRSYQARVIADKEVAAETLSDNVKAVDTLMISYKDFVSTTDNVIGGSAKGAGDKDGDNAKIVLDALPSKYDFPALATSLEKIFNGKSYKVTSISGTDDEIAQATNAATSKPTVVEMPFQIGLTSNFADTKSLLSIFERSIRPIKIQKLQLSGSNSTMTLTVTAQTYYQPEKSLNIEKKVVK